MPFKFPLFLVFDCLLHENWTVNFVFLVINAWVFLLFCTNTVQYIAIIYRTEFFMASIITGMIEVDLQEVAIMEFQNELSEISLSK